MRTDEQLKDIAMDILNEKIFTSRHLSHDSSLIPMVFLPLALMKEEQIEGFKNVKTIFEYYNKASSRGINGYPCFMSCETLTKKEDEKVLNYYKVFKEEMNKMKARA